MKIAVIGSTMMDIVSYMDRMPEGGETRRVEGFHIASGGKGANQAIAAAKLGADVVMMTSVGDDMFGEQSRKNFQNHHIDMSLVKTAKDTSNGIATIVVERSGQNRILINPGANEKLTPADIEKAGAELAACGLFVLQLEVPLETVYAAIRFAKKHGIKVLLNPAPASRELSLDMACQCDFFVPNETELSILVNKPVDTVAQVQKAAKSLVAQGLTNVIVTMGSRGSLLVTAEETQLVPSLKVDAVDSTGAGDAFIGCFVDTYARTQDVLGSMQRASQYAALSVTRKGTQNSYADAREFAAFLDA